MSAQNNKWEKAIKQSQLISEYGFTSGAVFGGCYDDKCVCMVTPCGVSRRMDGICTMLVALFDASAGGQLNGLITMVSVEMRAWFNCVSHDTTRSGLLMSCWGTMIDACDVHISHYNRSSPLLHPRCNIQPPSVQEPHLRTLLSCTTTIACDPFHI